MLIIFNLILKLFLLINIMTWLILISSVIFNASLFIGARPNYSSVDADVAAFWSAAVFAWNGMPLAAFDLDAMRAFQANADVGGDYVLPWLYPPALLILIMPLGLLNFIGAWIALVIASLVALYVALRRLDSSWTYLHLIVLFSPATLICAVRGQLSMLFGAAVLLGLSNLMRRRENRAVLWFSFVTLKPQLCLAFPVALVAARQWRLIGIGILLTAVLAIAPLPIVGFEYWDYWRDAVEEQSGNFPRLVGYALHGLTWRTLFAGFLGEYNAQILQLVFSVASLGLVAAVWARRDCAPALRVAALLFAMVSASPYALSYEALFPLIGSLVLVMVTWKSSRALKDTSSTARLAMALFVGSWLGPLVIHAGFPISISMMPLSLAGLILTLVLSRRIVCPSGEPEAQPETGQG